MWAITRATLLMICLSHFAGAQTGSMALYTNNASRLDDSTFISAMRELDRLLAPTGIDITWRSLSTRTLDEEYNRVAVVSFDGSCSSADVVVPFGKSQDSGFRLADTSVSNGQVLPFFRVDCTNVLQLLTPTLRPMSAPERSTVFGRALARVIAHELYHIVGSTTSHHARGVAKASLSARDLVSTRLDFDLASLTQMRQPQAPVSLVRSYTPPARGLVAVAEKVRER